MFVSHSALLSTIRLSVKSFLLSIVRGMIFAAIVSSAFASFATFIVTRSIPSAVPCVLNDLAQKDQNNSSILLQRAIIVFFAEKPIATECRYRYIASVDEETNGGWVSIEPAQLNP